MAELFAASLFFAGYTVITMEHRLFVNKAASSLVLAVALWLLVGITRPGAETQELLVVAGSDIFSIIIFLITAMTLVEVLIHYHFFDFIERTLQSRGWTYYQLAWAIAVIAFVFSIWINNLTTAIVAVQIARRLFSRSQLIPVAAVVIIASNAGGAFSPIGDVTTLMLWFAGKFNSFEIITQGILPSITLALVSAVILLRCIPHTKCSEKPAPRKAVMSRSDRAIIAATLGAFLLPLVTSAVGLPAYLGLLAGLGFVWLLIDVARQARPQQTHLEAKIKKFFQEVDIESIQFFVGILLAVSALHAMGVLEMLTDTFLGATPSAGRLISAFVGLGLSSAIIDNVPLTAAIISALGDFPSHLAVLLAITVGTGGSLLVIGSAAGIITMGMIPELTFTKYLRVGTLPALVGYIAAVGVWGLQYWIFF